VRNFFHKELRSIAKKASRPQRKMSEMIQYLLPKRNSLRAL
jgi:hypothetical protein